MLKKMVWKKIFAGGRVIFNWVVRTISKKGDLTRMRKKKKRQGL